MFPIDRAPTRESLAIATGRLGKRMVRVAGDEQIVGLDRAVPAGRFELLRDRDVSVAGDLTGIELLFGSQIATVSSLHSLTVNTMGLYRNGAVLNESSIAGSVGALSVKHDMRAKDFEVFATASPEAIGKIDIGGSLIGGNGVTGLIEATGDIGPVHIGEDVVGGPGEGRQLLVWPAGHTYGDLGWPRLNQRVALYAEQLFEKGPREMVKAFDVPGGVKLDVRFEFPALA